MSSKVLSANENENLALVLSLDVTPTILMQCKTGFVWVVCLGEINYRIQHSCSQYDLPD